MKHITKGKTTSTFHDESLYHKKKNYDRNLLSPIKIKWWLYVLRIVFFIN